VLALIVQRELREVARRMLAGEPRGGQWRPTELVQEAYLRLLDWRAVHWQNRAHFFSTAASMMRHALVDSVRSRRAIKRGEGLAPLPLDGCDVPVQEPGVDILALDDALQALTSANPRAARIVELRFFGGFSVQETAEALGISVRTVINDWNTARAWLGHQLAGRE
jgi:RNA polymerase sigma-70 factor, ECF subfamily